MTSLVVVTRGCGIENGDIEDVRLSLETVSRFINRMLCETEETKRILQMECAEAKFALKPWPIESMVIRQLDRNTCTCNEGINSEYRAEEIATDIEKALAHTQQLREKLTMNLQKERQNTRIPEKTREIYGSGLKSQLKSSDEKENDIRKVRSRRSISQQRPSEPRGSSRFRSSSSVRARSNDAVKPEQQMGKLLKEPSRNNISPKPMTKPKAKGPTNFILANKLSVRSSKGNKQTSKSQTDLTKTGLSVPKSTGTTTRNRSNSVKGGNIEQFSELDKLIKKFTSETNVQSLALKNNCPVHAENTKGIVEEKIVTSVDAVEGLNRCDIPSPILKILKIYHTYLKQEMLNDAQIINKKTQDSRSYFLTNFQCKRHVLPHMIKYQDLLIGLSSLYADSSRSDYNKQELKKFKDKFIALDLNYNECNIKNKLNEIKFVRSHSDQFSSYFSTDMRNWMSNGIWNRLSITHLKEIFGAHCTRYSDRNQLMSFYEVIQTVQRKVYEAELIELLMLTVVPNLKKLFDPDSKDFIEAYKMIVAVTQILNLKVPVLAKTESDDN